MNTREEDLKHRIRMLVKSVHEKCYGAYGSDKGYEGEYEKEIDDLVRSITQIIYDVIGEIILIKH